MYFFSLFFSLFSLLPQKFVVFFFFSTIWRKGNMCFCLLHCQCSYCSFLAPWGSHYLFSERKVFILEATSATVIVKLLFAVHSWGDDCVE